MSGMDIMLIVIGAVLIFLSYIISERITGQESGSAHGTELWSGRDEITVKDRVSIILADKSEQIVDNTEDRLCHISNEKIMEFQEFADQLFQKLDENHNQAVFLYKMLTEKQNEMKEWITELDSKYSNIKNELVMAEENVDKIKNIVAEKAKSVAKPNISTTVEVKNTGIKRVEKSSEAKKRTPQASKAADTKEEHPADRTVRTPAKTAASKEDKNEKILKLYDEGKSVLDISRLLGIGQGEVKLITDLYRGKKK